MHIKSDKRKSQRYLDSRCSRHITNDKDKFTFLEAKDRGSVTFKDNTKRKIMGIGEIGNLEFLSIHHVLLFDGLEHNLLN